MGLTVEMMRRSSSDRLEVERGQFLRSLRDLLATDADSRVGWIRENLETLMRGSGHDAVAISALTGISVGTVRGFLKGTDSSVRHVLLMALALGVELDQLAQPPEEFGRFLARRPSTERSSTP